MLLELVSFIRLPSPMYRRFCYEIKSTILETSKLALNVFIYNSYFYFQKNESFGLKYAVKGGRIFINESNFIIEKIKLDHLKYSSANIE